MISRCFIAACALLCALGNVQAQTGRVLTPSQLNAEINSTYADNNTNAITPFAVRQVTLDQVASGVIGTITLTGPVTGSGTNSIVTTLGIGAVDTTNLNADVFSTAHSWSGLQTFTGGVTGLPTPVNPTDAATKQYVDGVSSGISNVGASLLATATVLPNSPTYANGTAGVGATLTAGSNSTLTVDGTVATLNTIVLVKNQASAFQNGIYTVTAAGSGSAAWVLTRVTYFDIASQMRAGSYTFITGGSVNLNSGWTLAASVTTVGSDPLNWNQFSASGNGVQSIGSGLYTGAVTNAQITSSCNIFTSSLSGCVPSGSGVTTVSQLTPSGSWSAPTGVVLGSRAIAAALNLTGVSSVTTQGYANPGDSGGAVFKNVSNAPFIDSFISTGFINQAGSGCTNGTYTGVYVAGSATGSQAVATIVVSGGSVTSVSFGTTPGNAYAVGDQLTQNGVFTCSGSAFNWQVSTVTTPTGSFTDAAGNHWQIVVDQGNAVNVRQFGAKIDGSTDDTTSVQNAMNFAYHNSGTITSLGAGGVVGQRVVFPAGVSILNALTIPYGVWLDGVGADSTLLHASNSLSTSAHFITLCDPNTLGSCFGSRISNLGVFPGSGTPCGGCAMIFTNNDQDTWAISNVTIQPGSRQCINLTTGYGGASTFSMDHVYCGPNNASSNNGIYLDYGAAVVSLRDSKVESSSWTTGFGVVVAPTAGGLLAIDGFHTEGINIGIYLNSGGSGMMADIRNVTGGSAAGGCSQVIERQSGSASGITTVSSIRPQGCTYSLNNAGSTVNTDINGAMSF